MAAQRKMYKVKAKNNETIERVQTLVRALGMPEEQIVTEALNQFWATKESEVKQYVGKLFGETALFDESRPLQAAPVTVDDQDIITVPQDTSFVAGEEG